MKKKRYFISMLALGALITGCKNVTPTSSGGTSTPTNVSTTSQNNINNSSNKTSTGGNNTSTSTQVNGHTGLHTYSLLDHKGLIDLEKCDDCASKAYKFPVKYAEGWNDPATKMNAKTGSGSKSTWKIEGQLAPGKYEVEISAKLSQSSSDGRYWFNHAKFNKDQGDSNPDTLQESDYRYWIEVDNTAFYPTSQKTWGEEGLDASNFNRSIFIGELTVTSTTKTINLVHGNIGYSLIIDQVRLIAKDGVSLPNKLPSAPSGVIDPEGNQGGDTGGGSGTVIGDTSNIPDIGVTPGGEGASVYGTKVNKNIVISSTMTKDITLTSNHTGGDVSILHEGIQKYCDDVYAQEALENLNETSKYRMRDKAFGNINPKNYQGTGSDTDRDNFKNVVLTFDTAKTDATKFNVEVGRKADLSDAKVVEVTGKKVELVNLFTDTTYYWRVTDINNKYYSDIGSFHTKGAFRNISAGAAYNVRDIGGKMTSSGKRVKQGCIYRGGELTPVKYDTGIAQKHIITLDKTGKKIFHDDLNVRVELDFRNAGGESNNQNSSYLGKDVKYQREAVSSLAKFYNGDATMLKNIFMAFANATPDAAVYCHCWGGADRTGTAFFLLEGLLGVSYTEALMDYEFTSFDSIHTRRRDTTVTDYNNYSYNFPELLNTIKSSSYYSSTKSFSQIVESWLKGKVKMSDAEIQKLKTNLLED